MKKCFVALAVFLQVVSFTTADDAQDCQQVCTTRDCVMQGGRMAVKMDPLADPCHDFAQYACGGFYKDAVIPDDKIRISSFSSTTDDVDKILKKFVTAPVENDDKDYVQKMKRYYTTCMDEDKIEEIGLTPYTSTDYPNDWPTLNPAWDDWTFDLNDLVVKHAQDRIPLPLFGHGILTDMNNSTRRKLGFYQGGLFLQHDYYKQPDNSTVMTGWRQFYVDIAVALGADETTARRDAQDVLDFQRIMANITVPLEELVDETTLNNPTTLDALAIKYPYLDWHRIVQKMFDPVDYSVPRDLPVNDYSPKFFTRLEGVLSLVSQPHYKRVIQNTFGFSYASSAVRDLTKQMREIRFKYRKIFTGLEEMQPRDEYCYGNTAGTFDLAVSRAFVDETFSEDSKTYMNTMVDGLKKAFSGLLTEADWMSPKTKEAAFRKLDTLLVRIGYADKKFSVADIEEKYENYTIFDGEFYKTTTDIGKQSQMESLRDLNEPVDNDKFGMPPHLVNAYANPMNNEIGFPAGILQPPFFSATSPSSVNFGAIGMVIGHEITHGYDRSGSQYDYQGNLKNWWQSEDLEQYKNRTQCVIDQYSSYRLEEIDMNANGKATVGDDVGDIGGLKESFRAYKTYAASQPKEVPLPGLGLSTEQQFFLSFAQVWCEKILPAALKSKIIGNELHSPGRLRIIGPLQDSEDFAKVFKCPLGSHMNPVHKCVVW